MSQGGVGQWERGEASKAEEAQDWPQWVCSTSFICLVQVFIEGLLGRVRWYPSLGSVHTAESLPQWIVFLGRQSVHVQGLVCLRRRRRQWRQVAVVQGQPAALP